MKLLKKFVTGGAVAGGLAALAPLSAYAQVANVNLGLPGGSAFANTYNYTPTGLVQALINIMLVGAGLIAFFWLLYGGVQWILAGGDKEATEKARKRITAALIGLVIVFSVFAFTIILQAFFGVNLLNFSINGIV